MFAGIIKFIVHDVVLDALLFPAWWYTEGLLGMLKFLGVEVRRGAGAIGIGIWVKSLFKPMYGERSWQGRIISFLMRIVILVWKLALFFGWSLILLVLFILWVLVLPALVWQIIIVFRP